MIQTCRKKFHLLTYLTKSMPLRCVTYFPASLFCYGEEHGNRLIKYVKKGKP